MKSHEEDHGWLPVRTRCRSGWLRAEDLGEERPLEVNFVDIGQGNGSLVMTPDDQLIVVDAGEGSNMFRFLRWRFNLKPSSRTLPITAVITHPDMDHYKGFQKLFDDERFSFGTVFHNGIVEHRGRQPRSLDDDRRSELPDRLSMDANSYAVGDAYFYASAGCR